MFFFKYIFLANFKPNRKRKVYGETYNLKIRNFLHQWSIRKIVEIFEYLKDKKTTLFLAKFLSLLKDGDFPVVF